MMNSKPAELSPSPMKRSLVQRLNKGILVPSIPATPLALIVCSLLSGASQVQAQSPALVDPSKGWGGYMNVFSLPADGGGYQFGGSWGGNALRGSFSADLLTLQSCTNVSNPSDTYWCKPDGSGNKQMDASWYVDTASLVGSNVTFSGNVVDYTMTSN